MNIPFFCDNSSKLVDDIFAFSVVFLQKTLTQNSEKILPADLTSNSIEVMAYTNTGKE